MATSSAPDPSVTAGATVDAEATTAPATAPEDTADALPAGNTSGVTAASLRAKIAERLGAEHVVVEDVSGT